MVLGIELERSLTRNHQRSFQLQGYDSHLRLITFMEMKINQQYTKFWKCNWWDLTRNWSSATGFWKNSLPWASRGLEKTQRSQTGMDPITLLSFSMLYKTFQISRGQHSYLPRNIWIGYMLFLFSSYIPPLRNISRWNWSADAWWRWNTEVTFWFWT